MGNDLQYSGIYVIQNTQTGRIYIGQSRNIPRRLEKHKEHISSGMHPNHNLDKDLDKYSLIHFKFFVIEANIEHKDLNIAEYDYIRHYYQQGFPMYNIKGVSQSYVPTTLRPKNSKTKLVAFSDGHRVFRKQRTIKRRSKRILANTYKIQIKPITQFIRIFGVFLYIVFIIVFATVLALLMARLLGF